MISDLEHLLNLLKQLGEVAPATLATLVLVGFNLLLRRTPYIRNWSIPWLSVALGMFLFPLWLPAVTEFQNSWSRNCGIGFVVGLASAIGYRGIVKFAESKWPWLDDLITPNETDNQNEKNP